tara:strand:- start:2414 stop:2809 length:396 start_codon:yes stop_codon:yes gene_type:complete
MFEATDLIHSYTRSDAIADGGLIEVSEDAKEAGFKVPVALTTAAWHELVAWDQAARPHGPLQDEAGRLWDVLSLAIHAARKERDSNQVEYTVRVMEPLENGPRVVPKRAVMHIGPGDNLEPVITIMLPGED